MRTLAATIWVLPMGAAGCRDGGPEGEAEATAFNNPGVIVGWTNISDGAVRACRE